jgi:hypothetical protein
MSNFSIDIEKYYEELSAMGRQSKGVFCIQYPIYCIHSEISDSTPDPLNNLDKVIVDFLRVKPDFSSFQIGSIIGTSKTLVELRLDKLVSDGLLTKEDRKYSLTEEGISVFDTETQLRLHKQSYDFYIDGITLKPLPKVFYSYYKSKLISEHYSFYRTNPKTSERYLVKPFAPDIVHTPPEKNKISDLIFAIDPEQREDYGIPNGLQSIDEISYTKMSFQILVSVSKSKEGLVKELIDGHAIYSLGEESTYFETLRKNVNIFEPTLKERIQNLEFKLMIPFQKNDSSEKPNPILTTNLPEIDRYKESVNKCFNFSREDILKFLESMFGLKHIDQDSLIYEDDSVEIIIRIKTLEESPNRQKLVSDLIRKRDYRIFNNSLERNVFLFYLYYSTDDTTIKELIGFIKLIKGYQKTSFADFLKSHSQYNEKIRPYLILAGEYDLLEKYDIEKHMLNMN